ncbi:hypothetical protein J2W42_005053 [Rhizobium tibeticum]|nr:hypothetical protein [Rhizobium tibeticum]
MKRDARRLKFQEQRFRIVEGQGCGKGIDLSGSEAGVERGHADLSQIQAGAISKDLGIKWRLSIGKCDVKAELLDIKPECGIKVGDEELRLRGYDKRAVAIEDWRVCHGFDPFDQRRPIRKAMLSGNKLLGVAELEICFQYLSIALVSISGQNPPDLRRHGMVPLAMPSQVGLGLLSKVFDIGHGRALHLTLS